MRIKDHPIIEITKFRLREFYREPGALFWVFVFPVLMAVVLGIAFGGSEGARPVAAVVDTSEQPWLAAALEGQPVAFEIHDMDAADGALKKGAVDLIVVSDRQGRVTYIYDPAQEKSRIAHLEVDRMLQSAMGQQPVVATRSESPSRQGTRYIDFVIPGLIGLNIMGSSMWGIGYALVLARRRRVLRRLAATPMRRSHFLAGYLLFRLTFLTWEVAAIILFALFAFSVAIQGSLFAIGALSVLGAFAFTGLGLIVAARIESLEAANGWLNFLMLPSWLLSGTFFSYLRFPEAMHLPIRLLPLTALNDAMRAVFNEGAGMGDILFEFAVLIAWGVVSSVTALRLFKWQ